ncbi:MAG: HAD family hydrolase [Thermoplasmataceae archaeon]
MPEAKRLPALFIDRDGTINRDCPYCHDPGQIYIYEDAVDLIRKYASMGYLIIVISNQSGINRGYFSLEQAMAFNRALKDRVQRMGGRIDDFFICPHRPDEGCDCRKPRDGLIRQALKKYKIDLENSVFAGDSIEMDGALAKSLGIRFIHLSHDR